MLGFVFSELRAVRHQLFDMQSKFNDRIEALEKTGRRR
jgi:hypothetical protein